MNKQVIYFEKKTNGGMFLCMEAYKYGTDKEYKTFSSAIKKAQQDFKKEVNFHLSEIGVKNISIRLIEGAVTYKIVTIKVN